MAKNLQHLLAHSGADLFALPLLVIFKFTCTYSDVIFASPVSWNNLYVYVRICLIVL
jgi:hypothetical protein